jgi:phenylpropionate dioxygenase-like ring-hydroxylating dioxygenase large terminal subunit
VFVWLGPDPGRLQDAGRELAAALAAQGFFWKLTSEQDWDLCERNQSGVRNPAYRPGPYSPRREYNVLAFIDWYLARLGADQGLMAPP